MEADVETLMAVGRGERAPERVTSLNGYRERAWETRVGEIEQGDQGWGILALRCVTGGFRDQRCPW